MCLEPEFILSVHSEKAPSQKCSWEYLICKGKKSKPSSKEYLLNSNLHIHFQGI